MSSHSSSSSTCSTPSPSSSPPQSLSSFDPFAVHPFTSYAGPSTPTAPTLCHPNAIHIPSPSSFNFDGRMPSSSYDGINGGHGHVGRSNPNHRPSGGSPSSQIPPGVYPQSSITPSAHFQPIHVPFRQDTSSPELPDVLRRKRMGH